jgi:hypothetical protein
MHLREDFRIVNLKKKCNIMFTFVELLNSLQKSIYRI